MQPQSLQRWQHAERLLSARQHDAARTAYSALLTDPALASMAHLRLSLIASVSGRYRDSVEHAIGAYASRQADPDVLEMVCKRLITLGEMQAAIDCATSPVLLQTRNPATLAELGKLMSDHVQPVQALQLLERARLLGLDTAAIRYLIGLSQMYVGDLVAAEEELNGSLAADPDFARAARVLSKLKAQTVASNHVERLRASIARIGKGHADAPLLHYALFKELDDLGEAEAAWQALSEGMRLRRRQVNYDAVAEATLFERLHEVRGGQVVATDGGQGPTPIFIVGMPRSGTTLLERILGAHADVADAGELRDFIFQLRWMCDRMGGPHLDLELVRQAEHVDWSELGKRYLSHTQWRANGRAFYTDKLPANFSNLGYIAKALPQAKILHMVRDPMDTCFSNLKELFANAYTHSYDQIEMADHYHRYRQLMAHWHTEFPGRILDVRYDQLVVDPERVAREVLAFCGLPWQDGVIDVDQRSGAVATASATQVREPIHQRFVAQWRKYETQLAPMQERLESYAY